MISSKDILNGNDGLSFPSPRLCREMMVYLFHRYNCRDVIHTKVVNESAKEHPVSFVGNQIRGNT